MFDSVLNTPLSVGNKLKIKTEQNNTNKTKKSYHKHLQIFKHNNAVKNTPYFYVYKAYFKLDALIFCFDLDFGTRQT